jgi:hypothetical protein
VVVRTQDYNHQVPEPQEAGSRLRVMAQARSFRRRVHGSDVPVFPLAVDDADGLERLQ